MLLHRNRATLIRRLNRLPSQITIGVLTPEVVRAIARGTTSILGTPDDKAHRRQRQHLMQRSGTAPIGALCDPLARSRLLALRAE
jgi:hypothetical protein